MHIGTLMFRLWQNFVYLVWSRIHIDHKEKCDIATLYLLLLLPLPNRRSHICSFSFVGDKMALNLCIKCFVGSLMV